MKTVCVQCRIRKVRCNGEQPTCNSCSRLNYTCSLGQSQRSLEIPRKRRGARACMICRAQKVRCMGEMPACTNCRQKNRQCTYPPRREKGGPATDSIVTDLNDAPVSLDELGPQPDTSLTINNPSSNEQQSPSEETVAVLVTDYFERLFHLPSYEFLHRATVIKRCQEKSLDESLKLSLCAITALYTFGTSLSSDAWADSAQQIVWQNLSRPSVFHLQSLLLIVRYRAGAGDFSSAFLLAGLAARLAMGLRLNYERSDLSPIAQEVRRRTFWSLYLLNDIFSVGIKDFELCQPEVIHLKLPCEDQDFDIGKAVTGGGLQPDENLEIGSVSIRGLYLRVTFIRREIMKLNRKLYLGEFAPPDLMRLIKTFEYQLEIVQVQFRSLASFQPQGVENHLMRSGPIMLQMSIHQCYCDLYRNFLTGYSEAVPTSATEGIDLSRVAQMRKGCLDHAQNIIQLLIGCGNTPACDPPRLLDFDAAVCLYHSLRLQLFAACATGTGSTPRVEMNLAVSNTKDCLEIMTRLFGFLKSVTPMLKDLERLLRRYTTEGSSAAAEREEPSHSNHVARDASIRQRFSIHSLLLQADFVDDSSKASGSSTEPCPVKHSFQRNETEQQVDSLGQYASFPDVNDTQVLQPFHNDPEVIRENHSFIFNASCAGFFGGDELGAYLGYQPDDFSIQELDIW
ncbi:conserved hypothetical protein [Talaromyces stipitatus ATCC 10500]|uniref:Zn(2)-C6 fungal-type domain-containing protein n=1 Tax=Talaromyces stipitatus (strain ATCC 10500 / CBS 375.48 / QM 6759 / NRRL 1006) TaxID=441959 RepID=B8MCW2_TALSN|nr:uncharacterized protein TSTA_113140 [Talaromyces stipitatus ATCC 10500]EED17488.1 conserved hypothetical protein [Talaromyces stipitatus ATCC 10500]